MQRLIVFACFLSLTLTSCDPDNDHPKLSYEEVAILPAPAQMQPQDASFIWEAELNYFVDSYAEDLTDFIDAYFGMNPSFNVSRATDSNKAQLKIISDNTLESEHYRLDISSDQISIFAKDASGAFYGLQSLRQLLPTELESTEELAFEKFELPGLSITDGPQFEHRGMHLDVSRHFFGVDAVKRYLDVMALMKMNSFHWHLTDDQGWRIEIKKYPKLTNHGAYRPETLIGHYNDSPQKFDGQRYGGYYSQEEIKEVVAYAQSLNIRVIPEIEMPGHATAAISAYPDLGCTGDSIAVATKWGVFDDIFCPKPETFDFLFNVLDEVIALFPGEYIHIGGDEAPKTRWKACPHCQQLIKDENLKDEHELQSFFISEIAGYLNGKGKKLLGWDEILEGGLDPTATVMSWRGVEGGIQAAKSGNNVIMSPTSHAYFDYYQDDSADQPLAIGGFLPLEKVYSFDPIPEALNNKQAALVLGAQGNVWTEYMQTEEKLQYMAYPRTMAMAEVVWSGAKEEPEVSYPDFLKRLKPLLKRLDAMGRNYYNPLEKITAEISKEDKLRISLSGPLPEQQIQYRWSNEQAWIDYSEPIMVERSAMLEARFADQTDPNAVNFTQDFTLHKGINAKIKLNKKPHPAYNSGGIAALNNGVYGSSTRHGDKEWLGFWGDDLRVDIRFETPVKLNKLKLGFYHAPGQWIYAPTKSQISATLADGRSYNTTAIIAKDSLSNVANEVFGMPEEMVTRIRIDIPNYGIIPDGKQGAGNKAWTFLDEIVMD